MPAWRSDFKKLTIMTKEKFPVYQISCEQTDLNGLQTDSLEALAEIINADVTTVQKDEIEQLEYKITIDLMTVEQYNSLPEYQP